jgi:hypothetical protein
MPLLMRQCRDYVVCCSKFCDFLQKSFVYSISMDKDLCVAGVFVPLACLDMGCVRMSVCIDADVLKMAALKGSYDGLFMIFGDWCRMYVLMSLP